MQCDILIALCGFHRAPLHIDDKLTPAEQQRLLEQNELNEAYNEWLDGTFTQLGLHARTARCLPRCGVPEDKFPRHNIQQLVGMYQASRARSAGLNCECCQMPELSALLGE